MGDTLKVCGTTYSNVAGIKAYDTNGNLITYTSGGNSYTANDEGKVVSNGALVSQTSATYTTNGTYDTTIKNSVTVNVPASAVDSGTKSITANGNNQSVVGYASVNVNVPNSYTSNDENKVVSNGALVAQTTHAEVTQNGTIDTTLNNSVTVNVSGGISQGIEVVTDANGKITDYIVHGFTEVPALMLNYIGYNGTSSDVPLPTISFADKPVSFEKGAINNGKVKIDFSSLSELEKVAGEYAFVTYYISQDPATNVVVDLPKFKGYVDNTYAGLNCFRSASDYAPKKFILPVMTNIPRYAWYGYKITGLDITIGSVGHSVTASQGQPFSGTSNASGTVTIYTDGSHLDTIKASVQQGAGSGLTFVYKASENTTYNGTSYAAGATMLTVNT